MTLTLDEYTTIAIKIISKKIGYRYITDDNIGLVIRYLIYADQNYNPKKGSLNNFRHVSAFIAIKQIVCRKKSNLISLSNTVNIDGNVLSLSDIIPAKEQEQVDLESVNKLINDSVLTDIERFYLKEYFVNHRTQENLANERGVTKNAVSISIIKALKKLKDVTYVKD